MGYCHDSHGRLVCDSCGNAGQVRKRTCPIRVHYADGGSLPYCQPAALCPACYDKHKDTLHADCQAGAERSNLREQNRKIRLQAGELEVRSAWGDWHALVPPGMVGVFFDAGRMPGQTSQAYRLVPASVYRGGDTWLSDYPTAEPWEGPNGQTTKRIA